MSSDDRITQLSVREFMLKNNGKVRNHDLVTHFRKQLNDPVNKSKVRADFKEIVHTLATVQTIDGEKYFVLKKTKEAPAVLRKPPRTHAHPKSRPVSGPPVFRNTKVLEEFGRSASVGGSILELTPAEKENRLPAEGINKVLAKAMSVDSAMESDTISTGTGSNSSTPQLLRKTSTSKTADNADGVSQGSTDELEKPEDELEGDEVFTGPTIHLEPIEKEWLLTTAKGNRAQIMCLLELDPNLACKKNFASYTALHWAAKHGRKDIIVLLGKTGMDVNVKTHGYTPLHLAALHGHDDVIKCLVDDYDADINIRDYSGKKPRQLAKDTLTIEAQNTSSETSSGYGSTHQIGKYGSLNSMMSPSAMLASSYVSSDVKQPTNDSSSEKPRDRSQSFGKKFLKKNKQKKDRTTQVPNALPGATAGQPPRYFQRQLQRSYSIGPSPSYDRQLQTTVLRHSFRRLLGTTMDAQTSRHSFSYSYTV